ncbi:mechanosensitive ion channel [Oligoflexaceae bacterium]|nr:mechanosensitive ion channel [Oligoflexaceae bacterium]
MLDKIDLEKIEKYIPLLTEYAVKIAGAIILMVAAFFIAGQVKKMTMKGLRKASIDETLVRFFGNMTRWAVIVIALISLLGIFGVQTASFAAVIAAMGLAIGLAFQGTLANFAAGIMLLIFRPFRSGHYIKVNGEGGTVFEIGIFSTSIDTPDNRRVILPNSSVFGNTIENVSYHDTRRCDVEVGTSYDADLDKTRAALQKVLDGTEGLLSEPEAKIVMTGLGDSAVTWALRPFVKTVDYWTIREKLLMKVKIELDAVEIGIPYPQRDVHIYGQETGLK